MSKLKVGDKVICKCKDSAYYLDEGIIAEVDTDDDDQPYKVRFNVHSPLCAGVWFLYPEELHLIEKLELKVGDKFERIETCGIWEEEDIIEITEIDFEGDPSYCCDDGRDSAGPVFKGYFINDGSERPILWKRVEQPATTNKVDTNTDKNVFGRRQWVADEVKEDVWKGGFKL